MVEINLLPQQYRKQSEPTLWQPAAVGVVVLTALILIGVDVATATKVGNLTKAGAGTLVLSSDLAVVLTILWVVAVANAVNLVDGLDGLAAGMVAIAATAFFVYVVRSPNLFEDASQAAMLSAITAGICAGFLPWNFFPAKIFMGDTGSLMLGMLLALITISGVGRNPFPPSGGDVVATLVGHAHTMSALSFAGRPLLVGGGAVSTVTHDAEALPVIWMDAPVTFALHLHGDDGSLVTHWRALPV